MIPDGTSTALLSISRLYAQYIDSSQTQLAIDPYICGLVMSHSSDAPIGDSAPTTSCYVTGQPSQTGFVATYPVKTDHDLYPIDSSLAYQPMATVMEAARILKHKATGLVFTCEFPHATPADHCAHTYNRNAYSNIAAQMTHNKVDVVIGGGSKYLNESLQNDLRSAGYRVYINDKEAMLNHHEGKMWALYNSSSMDYDIDRDPEKEPSIAEMTRKAIELLSKKPEGFYLLVEGSKVDFAAHNNDAKAAIMDFLAFNEAVKEAIGFAEKDGHTVVLVLPDHGCGGLNMSNRFYNSGYDKLSLQQLMDPIRDYSISTDKMASLIKKEDRENIPQLVKKYYNYDLSEEELNILCWTKDPQSAPMDYDRNKGLSLDKALSNMLYRRTIFGSTSYGHTGEDVFLACYHPKGDRPRGVISNIAVNDYLCRQLGLSNQLPRLTDDIFAKHSELFQDAQSISIERLDKDHYRLIVEYPKHQLTAESNANCVIIDQQSIDISSVIVYMEKNNSFYLPRKLKALLQ